MLETFQAKIKKKKKKHSDLKQLRTKHGGSLNSWTIIPSLNNKVIRADNPPSLETIFLECLDIFSVALSRVRSTLVINIRYPPENCIVLRLERSIRFYRFSLVLLFFLFFSLLRRRKDDSVIYRVGWNGRPWSEIGCVCLEWVIGFL